MADRAFAIPTRYGLVETCAAKHMARYGYFPPDFMRMVQMYCGGVVPARVTALAEQMRGSKPWAIPEAEINPHPGMTRVHFGPHSFLVKTSALFGGDE